MSEMKTYETHPAAEIFPPMPPHETQELAEDIRQNGLREPIIRYEGKILDGRHRVKACAIAGVSPEFVDLPADESPARYVWSTNWTRRHLKPSQRAAIIQDFNKQLSREAKKRMSTGGKISTDQGVERIPPLEKGKTRDKLAEIAHVNPRYISDAKQIAQKDPRLLEDVKEGRLTIPKAMKKLKQKTEDTACDKTVDPVTEKTAAPPKEPDSAPSGLPTQVMAVVIDVSMGTTDSERRKEILADVYHAALSASSPAYPRIVTVNEHYEDGTLTSCSPGGLESVPVNWQPIEGMTGVKSVRAVPMVTNVIDAPGLTQSFGEWEHEIWTVVSETVEPGST